MRPAAFEYVAPRTVEEALELLARHGRRRQGARGRPEPGADDEHAPGAPGRRGGPEPRRRARGGDAAEPGRSASARSSASSALERDPRIAAAAPLLAEAAPVIGHLQTRARGTIGGSVAHADPAAELPACLIALDAVLHLQSARGARACRAEDFFHGLLATALEPDDLLAEIEVPARRAPRTGHGFAEVARRHGDFALVGACAVVGLDDAGACREARLVIFGAGDVPRLARATAALLGERPSPARLAEVGRAAAEEIDARGDLHATAAYRRRVAAGLAARALGRAAARRGGGVMPGSCAPRRSRSP